MNYVPKTDQDRTLLDSIRDLELQCRERVDLLEALRQSRQGFALEQGGGSEMHTPLARQREDGSPSSPGWIGDGTIPSLSYPELVQSPNLPSRPAARSQSSLDSVPSASIDRPSPAGRRSSSNKSPLSFFSSSNEKSPPPSTSPEKRTLLTTLRGKDSKYANSKKHSLSPRRLARPAPTTVASSSKAADLAADLAWNGVPYPPGGGEPSIPITKRRSNDIGGNYSERPRPNLAADAAATAIHKPADAGSHDAYLPPSKPAPKAKSRPENQVSRPVVKQGPTSVRNIKPGFDARTEGGGSGVPVRRPRMVPKSHPTTSSSGSRAGHSASENSLPSPASDDEFAYSPSGGPALNKTSSSTQDDNKPASLRSRNTPPSSDHLSSEEEESSSETPEERSIKQAMKRLPKGVDVPSARQILNEIVVRGDEVHWEDVAGLETAKKALKEAVVYPFLRPDLFMGLREPARGMLLFGPPGTGKTMLARAVATESHSTFFSVSASSLTSKWHGESEKLVRALFALAKTMAPSIIFVDEIDSLLSSRSTAGEGEASRRSKTEFLIQWSDLQRAAAGREQTDKDKKIGDPSRVLVLAATNMPWDIDEAARRRFVRRQYIPLPEDEVRKLQFQKLLSHQKHELTDSDIDELVKVTDGK